MKAALLIEPGKIEIREVAPPDLRADEVMISPILIGVCGSDLSFYVGHRPAPYPFLLGHEVVGRVTALGEGVEEFKVGQRVIVEPNYPCGACSFCHDGRGAICPHKRSMGVTEAGCLAAYATAPAEFVWALPDSISDQDAATIEPLTVSLHALLQSGVQMGDTVAVLGCGVVGLLLIHAAAAQGVRVLAYDKNADKLDMARRLGAVVGEANDIAQQWLNDNVHVVFECAGVAPTVELALRAAPRGSQIILVGLSSESASFVPLRLVREGIRIHGSMIYDHPADFARAIALVESGVLHPARIVTDTVPFEASDRALQLARAGRSGKIHIQLE
jgi:L-iditol 2-dehydrogenase